MFSVPVFTADEAERLRNLEDDLNSDGGWDTDTLQPTLVSLSHTPHPYNHEGVRI